MVVASADSRQADAGGGRRVFSQAHGLFRAAARARIRRCGSSRSGRDGEEASPPMRTTSWACDRIAQPSRDRRR